MCLLWVILNSVFKGWFRVSMKKEFINKVTATTVYQFATGHKPLLSFRRKKGLSKGRSRSLTNLRVINPYWGLIILRFFYQCCQYPICTSQGYPESELKWICSHGKWQQASRKHDAKLWMVSYVVSVDRCSKATELSDHFIHVIENRFG